MDYILKSFIQYSGYRLQNTSNMYNFMYDIIQLQDNKESKEKIMNLIKQNIGITFYNDFSLYTMKKYLATKFK